MASRRGTAQWCSISSSAAAESFGISSSTSQASSSFEDLEALRASLGARERAGLHPLLALDAEPDQGADRGAQLDRLVLGQVAQMRDLDLAVGVLVNGQSIDHAHRIALAQPLELLDDLAVELGVLEAQHDQLHGSDGHAHSSLIGAGERSREASPSASSRTGDQHLRRRASGVG
jgi:hypothetical protein